jgi:hypothetical protein
MDRPRAVDAALGQMIHQAEEERQVARIDALFVERDHVLAALGGQHVVGVLDALGDALEGDRPADVVVGEKGLELRVADFRVDRHQATSCRGSLKTTLSSVVRTSSTGDVVALAAGGDQLVDQKLRARGAGGDAEAAGIAQPVPVHVGGALHQFDLAQP